VWIPVPQTVSADSSGPSASSSKCLTTQHGACLKQACYRGSGSPVGRHLFTAFRPAPTVPACRDRRLVFAPPPSARLPGSSDPHELFSKGGGRGYRIIADEPDDNRHSLRSGWTYPHPVLRTLIVFCGCGDIRAVRALEPQRHCTRVLPKPDLDFGRDGRTDTRRAFIRPPSSLVR
jgi:hypothetical protein